MEGTGRIVISVYEYRPFGQTILEKIILLLFVVNLIAPTFDQQHPTSLLWTGVLWLIEKWVEFIGWVMSWFTSFLPRTTSLRGTGQFLLSTVITIVIILVTFLLLSWLYKRWIGPFLKKAGFFHSMNIMIQHVVFQSLILLGLIALFVPTILRLMGDGS